MDPLKIFLCSFFFLHTCLSAEQDVEKLRQLPGGIMGIVMDFALPKRKQVHLCSTRTCDVEIFPNKDDKKRQTTINSIKYYIQKETTARHPLSYIQHIPSKKINPQALIDLNSYLFDRACVGHSHEEPFRQIQWLKTINDENSSREELLKIPLLFPFNKCRDVRIALLKKIEEKRTRGKKDTALFQYFYTFDHNENVVTGYDYGGRIELDLVDNKVCILPERSSLELSLARFCREIEHNAKKHFSLEIGVDNVEFLSALLQCGKKNIDLDSILKKLRFVTDYHFENVTDKNIKSAPLIIPKILKNKYPSFNTIQDQKGHFWGNKNATMFLDITAPEDENIIRFNLMTKKDKEGNTPHIFRSTILYFSEETDRVSLCKEFRNKLVNLEIMA